MNIASKYELDDDSKFAKVDGLRSHVSKLEFQS
jgi:hypothetical protein